MTARVLSHLGLWEASNDRTAFGIELISRAVCRSGDWNAPVRFRSCQLPSKECGVGRFEGIAKRLVRVIGVLGVWGSDGNAVRASVVGSICSWIQIGSRGI